MAGIVAESGTLLVPVYAPIFAEELIRAIRQAVSAQTASAAGSPAAARSQKVTLGAWSVTSEFSEGVDVIPFAVECDGRNPATVSIKKGGEFRFKNGQRHLHVTKRWCIRSNVYQGKNYYHLHHPTNWDIGLSLSTYELDILADDEQFFKFSGGQSVKKIGAFTSIFFDDSKREVSVTKQGQQSKKHISCSLTEWSKVIDGLLVFRKFNLDHPDDRTSSPPAREHRPKTPIDQPNAPPVKKEPKKAVAPASASKKKRKIIEEDEEEGADSDEVENLADFSEVDDQELEGEENGEEEAEEVESEAAEEPEGRGKARKAKKKPPTRGSRKQKMKNKGLAAFFVEQGDDFDKQGSFLSKDNDYDDEDGQRLGGEDKLNAAGEEVTSAAARPITTNVFQSGK